MTIKDMKDKLQEFCDIQPNCDCCRLYDFSIDCVFNLFSKENIEKAFEIAFGGEERGCCEDCEHCDKNMECYPCKDCINNGGTENNFKPYEEEINHPDRYKSGKYECIDVMQDVYGKEAVKHFCICNAFKYIWRYEKKSGVQDLQKAIWYLNKCIEVMNDAEIH